MNTVRLETNRGVDGDVFTGAVPSVEDHGLFLTEVFEVLRLVAERVSGETVSKADQAEGEVVPGEPGGRGSGGWGTTLLLPETEADLASPSAL